MRRAAWPGAMAALGFSLALALVSGAARADTPIALFKSFAGNVNFVGTQKTMRTKANIVAPCEVTAAGTTISATLAGIPAGAVIQSAQLYWAGSNSTVDSRVVFEGADVAAPAARQFFSNTIGSGFDYFAAAADVTPQVVAKRNGDYTFSGLAINNGAPYCAASAVVGGFALLVVYADPAEQFRVLNLYEGFQSIRNSSVTLTLGNFRTPTPLLGATARVSHIAWEGDPLLGLLDLFGESVEFNRVELSDLMNPLRNQFNSVSNINADSASYGIDFDAYTVGAGVIAAGQTSATARYQSGSDLVLLNAAIIAMPNVPVADLSIAMTRNSALVQGRDASYTLNVANAGPNAETGPVVVVDTLPAGMTYGSAGGAGWSCAASAGLITCSRAGGVAVGETLPPLTITALVTGSGTLTNSASVSGKLFDNVSDNNTVADSAAVEPAPAYAFTDAACVNGQPFGAALQTCRELTGAALPAGATLTLYITAMAAGVPTRLDAKKDTTVAMAFALSCHNPGSNAGVNASVAGAPLPLCTPNGGVPAAWSGAAALVFPANAPSAPAGGLVYADVGKIQLFLRDAAARVVGSVPFVSKPASLAITAVVRSFDNVSNPKPADGAGNGFARVGEAITIRAAALTVDGAVAPNFGNEGARLALDAQRGGDAAAKAAMLSLPALAGDFGSIVGGVFTGAAFAVDEAGILAVTPRLAGVDYLGAGVPAGAAVNVGRFYPDHFDTLAVSTLQCLPHMGCPAGLAGAAYSRQPFAITVTPLNGAGVSIRNYNGVLARPITLSAWSDAGGAAPNPAGGALTSNVIAASSIAAGATIDAKPVYSLPAAFSNALPRARNWTAPTAIYVRAGAEENAAGVARVSSLRPNNSNGSGEAGIMIVSGRLGLDSPSGSELVRMPVRAEAQYWAATGRWETSATDNFSTVQSGGIAFANCRLGLAPCDTSVLKVAAPASLPLKAGIATFWLSAPGAGKAGSAELQMNNPAWLPSTVGRAVFGAYKSPLIYVREVY